MDPNTWKKFLFIFIVFLIFKYCISVGGSDTNQIPIQYNMAALLDLRFSPLSMKPPSISYPTQEESHTKVRRRGRRGGVKERIKRRKTRPYLPSVIMGNAQSLNNKLDELSALVKYKRSYGTTSLICFTETWFKEDMNDDTLSIDGFSLHRGDRQREEVDKIKGGGICVYVNDRWCNKNNVHTKKHICTPDLEMLTLSLRPHYIPREFSNVFVVTVYVACKGNTSAALSTLAGHVHDIQTSSPDSFILINGDFNNRSLNKVLPSFRQQVKCSTRGSKTLDLCYTNVKDVYISQPLPALGRSDHNLVQLLPRYIPKIKQEPPVRVKIKCWTEDAIGCLIDCFQNTTWYAFIDSACSVNELTDTVCEYINFCVDTCVPSKVVTQYKNNKPWMNSNIKSLIDKKNKAFRSGDKNELKSAEKELRREIRRSKQAYKDKIEQRFSSGNAKQMWEGLRTMTGFQKSNKTASPCVSDLDVYVNELNEFYARFDSYDFSKELIELKDVLNCNECYTTFEIEQQEVERAFKSININKGCGPDKIHPKVLKNCYDVLSFIFTYIFNQSLKNHVVPEIWKTSCIVPVPKKSVCKEMNDLRPVAMTSVVMKVFERLVLSKLQPLLSHHFDPLQFAYRKKRSVEDAVLYVVNEVYKHLDQKKQYVRLMFFDFSSAFNTIQPHLMGLKLKNMNLDTNTILWILDYLTNRPQYIQFQNHTSQTIVTQTGAPQGTVLSPFLFSLYTSDSRLPDDSSCVMVKYADDTSLCGLIRNGDETEYRHNIDKFVKWCRSNYLLLNVSKTKELIIDFRINKNDEIENPITIDGECVERVKTYKYLGIVFDESLNWAEHVTSTLKKCNSRLHLLRKLRSFDVSTFILSQFYNSVLHSVLTFGVLCWGGNISCFDVSRIDGIIRKAGKVVGEEQICFRNYLKKRDMIKFKAILSDDENPLHNEITLQQLKSGRFRLPKMKTERFRSTFVPRSLSEFNKCFKRGNGSMTEI